MPPSSTLTTTLTPYHAKYIAYELTRRSASDSMQKLAAALLDAQVDLNPHQVEAALFAFRSPLSKGAILADEVGLGKTIEAGLVIAQKWAERKRKILIVTPANLQKQWNQELQDKFFLPSVILEAKSFNNFIKQGNFNPFSQAEIVICSYQFVKSKAAYVKAIDWDLVVVDEAHRLRNVYKSESKSKIAWAIKDALEKAPKILLTATPFQNNLLELYGLVSIIDSYTFGDLSSFKAQYGSKALSQPDQTIFRELKQRLEPVCKRTLRRQVLEYIKYTDRIPLVEEFYPTEQEQLLYNYVSDYLQRDELYALPASQRKLMTLILRRLLASSTYAISGTLEALVKKLELIVTNNANIQEPLITEDDFNGLAEMEEEWLEDDEEEEINPIQYTEEDIQKIKAEIELLKEFEALAKSISKNSKGEKLCTALSRGFQEMERLGAPQKAIIFTESTRTQNYIKEILETRGYGGKVVLFNGSNNDPLSKEIYSKWIARHKGTDRVTGSPTADMRAALVDHFRNEATIMIATEAAAEGINLQFCSLLINYDLPWNPQRIEQRIGRCHRYGQKYNVVVINFLNKANAADQRVYKLLAEKFLLFDGVFGASDEVLGSIEGGIDFEKRIAQIYQDCRTAEQIDIAFEQLRSEMEEKIGAEMDNTKQRLLENFDEEVHEKLRINLAESKAYISKYESLLWDLSQYFLGSYASFSDTDHAFTLHQNPFPHAKFSLGAYRIGKNIQDAYTYRIGHPLAQLVIETCKSQGLPDKELVFDYSGTPKKISALEPYINKSGWLLAKSVTFNSFEQLDINLLLAVTDEGEIISGDSASRFFSLPAFQDGANVSIPSDIADKLEELSQARIQESKVTMDLQNNKYFQVELEKLGKWADDQVKGLEAELDEVKAKIKECNRLSKQAQSSQEQLKIQHELTALSSRQKKLRRDIFDSEDMIEEQRKKMIADIEKRMHLTTSVNNLFCIRWKLV
jgi:ERCC4-related helicase